MPRNIDPSVHEIDSAYLYDLDDLQEVADSNEEERRREVQREEQIIVEECLHFEGWLVALQAVPTIRDLTRRAEDIRRGEVDRFAGRLGLDDPRRDLLEQLTRSIVNKLLHAPISRLRDERDREAGLVRLEEARVLFGLDELDGDKSELAAGTPTGDDEREPSA